MPHNSHSSQETEFSLSATFDELITISKINANAGAKDDRLVRAGNGPSKAS
jgi:hypothetical protein